MGGQCLHNRRVLPFARVSGKHTKHADVGGARHIHVAHDEAAVRLQEQQQRGAAKVQTFDGAARCRACAKQGKASPSASKQASRAQLSRMRTVCT